MSTASNQSPPSDLSHALPADLITELQRRGYRVTAPDRLEWLTLNAVAQQAGRMASSVHRSIKRSLDNGATPPGLLIDFTHRGGGKRRIHRLAPTPEFYQWLTGKPTQ